MKKSRARAALLVLSLSILAILLGSISTGLAAPLFGFAARIPAVPKTQVSVADTGILVVNATLYNDSSDDAPIADANVSIAGVESGSYVLLRTNSAGEVIRPLDVGNYTVSVSDTVFGTTALVRVQRNATTVMDVMVNKTEVRPLLTDLTDGDGGSGFVSPWDQISVAINATASSVVNEGAVFIDASYGPVPVPTWAAGSSPEHELEVAAQAIASGYHGNSSSSSPAMLWLTLEPDSLLPLSGLISLTLVRYSVTVDVVTISGS